MTIKISKFTYKIENFKNNKIWTQSLVNKSYQTKIMMLSIKCLKIFFFQMLSKDNKSQ